MIQREKSHIVYFKKKKEKPQSIYRTAICTENQIEKNFFRKDSPNAPNVCFLKLKNIKPSFTVKLVSQPSFWDGKYFLPFKNQLRDRNKGTGGLKRKRGKKR